MNTLTLELEGAKRVISDLENALSDRALDIAFKDAEVEKLQERIAKLEAALRGVASCATKCPCCEMHNRIATNALTGDGSVLMVEVEGPGLIPVQVPAGTTPPPVPAHYPSPDHCDCPACNKALFP